MAIAQGKKRYQFTLTEKTMERLKTLYSEVGAPLDAMSKEIEESINADLDAIERHFKRVKQKGAKPLYTDLLHALGYEDQETDLAV